MTRRSSRQRSGPLASRLAERLHSLRAGVGGRLLIAFFTISLALWALLTVGGEAMEGETRAFDQWAVLRLRNPLDLSDPIGPRVFEEAMRDITALGGFTVLTLITVVAVIALWRVARRREAVITALVVLGAQLSSDGLKLLYARPRPTLVPHESYVYSNSFPSGHSAVSPAVYVMLVMVLAAGMRSPHSRAMTFALAILLVMAIGFSRIYLGVHWPTDVIGGWALGSAWAMVGWTALALSGTKPAT